MTFTTENTSKWLISVLSFRKNNLGKKKKRGIIKKIWKEINVERETKREKNKKEINFSNYSRSFSPQMLPSYARAVKLIAFLFKQVEYSPI